MPSTPERCECGGPAICERCGRILPDYHTMSLLDHIQKLEKGGTGLLEVAKQTLGWLKATHNWQPFNIESGRLVVETLEQAIAKAEREC
ncbi:hypothetical protein LCGC14_1579410 [marine sediment metagenome]|uniref:Uncharacterized protein n=1 Tax=marine sediment metagenome TaxID=412755 RepID=A0A0F9KY87_9ZZZZ